MKIKAFLSLLIILTFGCSDDLPKDKLESENLIGTWVPFEVVTDGTIWEGPFTSQSIFGVYAESLKLNDDKKYYPVIWTNKDEYLVKKDEIGDFEFIESSNKLILTSGPWDMEFTIKKITSSELWMSDNYSLYKLKREITTY